MAQTRLRPKGQLTLPEEIRHAARLADGAILTAELTDEGILLRPEKVVDGTQAWFWAPGWQAGEHEADADDAAQRGQTFETVDDFIQALASASKAGQPRRLTSARLPAFRLLPRFRTDFNRLAESEQESFLNALTKFAEDLAGPQFRKELRVKRVIGEVGLFEMTWAPGGSATFRYGATGRPSEAHIVWRRVGCHPIFGGP